MLTAAVAGCAGLNAVNISLDTLQPERFLTLTRRPGLPKVLRSIDRALELGFNPVKVGAHPAAGWGRRGEEGPQPPGAGIRVAYPAAAQLGKQAKVACPAAAQESLAVLLCSKGSRGGRLPPVLAHGVAQWR